MKQLELLEQRKFEDEDIKEDITFLMDKMNASVQDLSSYDEYVTEVSYQSSSSSLHFSFSLDSSSSSLHSSSSSLHSD